MAHGTLRYMLNENNKEFEATFMVYHLSKKIIINLIIKSIYVRIYMSHKEIHNIIKSDYF